MKLNIKKLIIAASILAAMPAVAQHTESGYFLDGYNYRYKMNPAYGNDNGFLSIPALGNMNVGLSGTLSPKDIFYNVDGRTTTFLNPKVPTSEVMSNIKDRNRLDFNMNMSVLSLGFKGFGGYNTLGVNVRTDLGMKLPGSIFSLLKEGIANKTYDIGNIDAYATGYAELSLGHSHNITSEIRIGVNAKLLVGAGYLKADMKHADLVLGENDWQIQTEGQINASIKGLQYETDYNETTGNYYVNDAKIDNAGINGMGVAFDLGAVYKPKFLPGFEFSLAVLDLGAIKWDNNMLASTNGKKTFNTNKYTFNVDDNATNSFKNEWEVIKDDISSLYELSDMGDQGKVSRALGATVNVGVLYDFPFYKKLKFGLLNTTRINGDFGWTNFRLSANVMPCKVFDAGINVTTGTFGMGWGWLINLHCPGINLFAGMDHMVSKMSKQYIPLNSNAQFNFGWNINF